MVHSFRRALLEVGRQRPHPDLRRQTRRRGLRRVDVEPEEEELVSSSDEEDEPEKRRKRAWGQHMYTFDRLKPEIQDLVKKEGVEGAEKLKQTLWVYHEQIKMSFSLYAAAEGDPHRRRRQDDDPAMVLAMDGLCFLKMCQDMDIVSRQGSHTTMPFADVDLIFVRANWERDDNGKFIQDETNPDRALLLFEFQNALLRIANSLPSFKGEEFLADRVARLMEDYVMAHLIEAEVKPFQRTFEASKGVRKCFKRHGLWLQGLFRAYCAGSVDAEETSEQNRTMSVDEFLSFCHEAKLFDFELFKEKHARIAFAQSQKSQNPDYKYTNPAFSVVIGWAEFKEALGRIAAKYNPDPYLGVHVKLQQLLDQLMKLNLQTVGHDSD